MILQLPSSFKPTHETGGLPGFPAVDVFAPAGTPVGCPDKGTVVKTSGHPPTPHATPGGPYGWSVYVKRNRLAWWRKGTYFCTHFGTVHVVNGQKVVRGQILGTVADYSAATNGVTPSHIHEGYHAGTWTP